MPPKRVSKKKSNVQNPPSNSPISKAGRASAAATTATEVSKPASEDGAVFFWREYGSEFAYLSQWYPSPFTTDEDKSITYLTAEQYMMYQKAVLFNDPTTGAQILQETSPKRTKALGRQVQNFDGEVWLANRERIVQEGSYFKFKNGTAAGEDMNGEIGGIGILRKKLLATGERELVEASPRDRIWGVGFGERNAESMRERWGLNLLGKALMSARKQLRDEEEGGQSQAV